MDLNDFLVFPQRKIQKINGSYMIRLPRKYVNCLKELNNGVIPEINLLVALTHANRDHLAIVQPILKKKKKKLKT